MYTSSPRPHAMPCFGTSFLIMASFDHSAYVSSSQQPAPHAVITYKGPDKKACFRIHTSPINFTSARTEPQSQIPNIPHICHFFYTDRIFENQILHPKKQQKAPKTLKMSLKKSNICIFFTQSGKIYT